MNPAVLFLRAFLKKDKEYYEILEIPLKSSQDEIKRAYKKLSLTNHPDKLAQRGIQVTDEHKQSFVKVIFSIIKNIYILHFRIFLD